MEVKQLMLMGRWELSQALRSPILELLDALLFFQAFAFRDPSIRLQGTDPYAEINIATFALLTALESVAELYLPIAAFAVILASLTFTLEEETGQLRWALSLPVPRGRAFCAKVAVVFLVLWLLPAFAILVAASAATWNHLDSILVVQNAGLVPGFLAATFVAVLPLVGVAVLIAVISRGTAFAIAGGLVALLIPWYAGGSGDFAFLPPASLRAGGLLWFANPYGSGEAAWRIAALYVAIGTAALAVAAWRFSRKEVGR